ncbi:hypothetical protein [Paenibacillus silvisoli]|uniref:hypothetical protein n=1 Tax=Paenibacillus silvisoli TaxID=3110539 RepID=UPI0028045EBA|nr:hypothetical protein [Paenibacillus silvisoli]
MNVVLFIYVITAVLTAAFCTISYVQTRKAKAYFTFYIETKMVTILFATFVSAGIVACFFIFGSYTFGQAAMCAMLPLAGVIAGAVLTHLNWRRSL